MVFSWLTVDENTPKEVPTNTEVLPKLKTLEYPCLIDCYPPLLMTSATASLIGET